MSPPHAEGGPGRSRTGSPRAPKAVLALLLALATRPFASEADTFTLTNPVDERCVTDDGAVYSVQNGELKPVRGQFQLFPPDGEPLQPRTAISHDGEPGQLLRMYAWSSEPLDSFSVQIVVPGKAAFTKVAGFRAESVGGTEMWVALVGVPAWSAAGEYSLTLSAASGQRSFILIQPFTVTDRRFFSERIPLTDGLTSMATVPDSKKTDESRILAAVLRTAHPDALFETGAFSVPLPSGRRTSGYGDRREYDYSDGSKGYSVHQGVDIASPTGTPVPACGRGRVVFADSRILTGNTVVIEHLPGLFSIYYHMSSLAVKVGDLVEKAQVIGTVGMTGFATGPHLHWEVENEGVAVDPDALVAGPLLDKGADFFNIEHAIAPKGGESNSLYRSQ